MKLTPSEIEKLALLSRLSLSKDEQGVFAQQLSSVLTYVNALSEVDTTGVEETAQVTGLENVYRDDSVSQCDLQEGLVAQAAESEDGYVKTKSVF